MAIQYVMRGLLTPPGQYVYWTSLGSPDLVGAQSGYNPVNLSGIVVDYSVTVPIDGYGGPIPQEIAGGDLSGTYPNPTVAKVGGAPVPFGPFIVGNVLQANGANSLTYAPVNLGGGSNFVSGLLPAANQSPQIMGGDISGFVSSATVSKLQNVPLSAPTPTSNQVLQYNGSNWVAATLPGLPPTGSAGGDLSGTYPNPIVSKIDGYSVNPSGPLVGQGFIYDGTQYSFSAHPIVTNVKQYGAKGDGITDDTAAIQAAFNHFSGKTNPNIGVIFFPQGTYKISGGLTFTSSVGNAIRFEGECVGAQSEVGTWIKWAGASGGTMLDGYGLNQSVFSFLGFDGGTTAAICIHFHTDQIFESGGAPSNGVLLDHCYFDGTSNNTNLGMVVIGDSADSHQVSTYYFIRCTFNGNGYLSGQTYAGVNILSGFNTEDFYFDHCAFSGMQYGLYATYFPNNAIGMRGTGFGNISGACVYLASGNAHLTMINCGSENGHLSAPVSGQGYFVQSLGTNRVHIESSELIMDCSNNTLGAIIICQGQLTIEHCVVDGSGEVAGVTNTASIITDNPLFPNGSSSVNIRANQWLFWPPTLPNPLQIAVYDGSNNNLTQVVSPYAGQQYRTNIHMTENFGTTGSNHLLPSFHGDVPTYFHLGITATTLPANQSNVYISEPRIVTTAVQINYQSLVAAATSIQNVIGVIPLKSKILSVYADVTSAFAGAGFTTIQFSCGDGYRSNNSFLLTNSIISTTSVPFGSNTIDLGGALIGTSSQGGDTQLWGISSVNLTATFTANQNFGNGSTTNLSAGSIVIYITTQQFAYP